MAEPKEGVIIEDYRREDGVVVGIYLSIPARKRLRQAYRLATGWKRVPEMAIKFENFRGFSKIRADHPEFSIYVESEYDVLSLNIKAGGVLELLSDNEYPKTREIQNEERVKILLKPLLDFLFCDTNEKT
jgi:hypothetical protein